MLLAEFGGNKKILSHSVQIIQLEKRLQGQVAVRCALEKALGYRSTCPKTTEEFSMPKVASKLKT